MNKYHELKVNNLKCGGCANTVKSSLSKIEGVDNIDVDVVSGAVRFDSSEDLVPKVELKLAKLGYSTSESSLADTVKSYVSCMVGKVSGS